MLVEIEIYSDGEYWCARGIGEDIFTQGKTLNDLINNIKEAVETHFMEYLERDRRKSEGNAREILNSHFKSTVISKYL